MTTPWRVYANSTYAFSSDRSLTDIEQLIAGKLKSDNKYFTTELKDGVLLFEPAGQSIFNSIGKIVDHGDQNYTLYIGIHKSILHLGIISSIFPLWPATLDWQILIGIIPAIWLFYLTLFWFTSLKSRKAILNFFDNEFD